MCSNDRPEDYQVPENYEPDAKEVQRMQQEDQAGLIYQEVNYVGPTLLQ